MKKSVKAALLSAFIFPGVGQLFLKKTVSGSILMLITITALFYVTSEILKLSQLLIEKIQSADVRLDVVEISTLVSEQMANIDNQMLDIASFSILICWIVSIIDAYRVGSQLEKIG